MDVSKQNKNSIDLTNGNILSKLLLVAIPIMGTQLIQMAYNLTDMFWLGRVGSDAVAAAGTVGMYLWLAAGFQMIGRLGTEIGVSQNLGRNKPKEAQTYAETGLFLSTLIGLIFAFILFIFKNPLIAFFNIQERIVVEGALRYLSIICIGIPFTFISASVSGIYNGSGNSKIPFIINVLGLGLNMILDPIIIFTFNQGVAGAALATVIAQIIVGLLSIFVLIHNRFQLFEHFKLWIKPVKQYIIQIIKWSLPVTIESILFTALSMIISRIIASWGAETIAAQKVGSQIESLSWLIAGGFSSALSAFIGQNFGANRWDRIHKGFKISSIVMLVWGIFVSLLLFFAGDSIVQLFLPNDPIAVEIGETYLKILSTCVIFSCLEGVASGAFRGIGKTLPPSIISVTSNVLRVVGAYALSATSLGLNGVWWAITLGAIGRGGIMYLWYIKTTKNHDKEILNN